MDNPYQLHEAEIVERIQEADGIFTLRLKMVEAGAMARYCAADQRTPYCFEPGQFNMVYLYGVGEIPISIVSDPEDDTLLDHTIRVVGRVTRGINNLEQGDRIGLRGPFGRGWPMEQARGKDVVIVTGGLGCAPVVSVINYIMRRREQFNGLSILQGVKHHNDLIWRERYEQWESEKDTQVFLAADVGGRGWPWHVGPVTVLFEKLEVDPENTIAMMCGPEGMMRAAAGELVKRGVKEESLWLSMERNMQCGVGHCGHCQIGGSFVCKDGPVFNYPEVKELFGVKGF